MIDEPITRPGEFGKAARDEIEFRVQVLSGISELKIMMRAHSEEDDFRFGELNKRLEGATNVVSGVATDRDRLDGAKNFGGYLLATVLSVCALLIAWFHK